MASLWAPRRFAKNYNQLSIVTSPGLLWVMQPLYAECIYPDAGTYAFGSPLVGLALSLADAMDGCGRVSP